MTAADKAVASRTAVSCSNVLVEYRKFHLPHVHMAPCRLLGVTPLAFHRDLWCDKTGVLSLPCHTSSGYGRENAGTQLCVSKKQYSSFDHKFSSCRPIYKILSLSDSCVNFVHTQHSPPHLKYVSTLLSLWNLTITIAADFSGILYVKPQSLFCKIDRLISVICLSPNPTTTKSGKQCS